jgi:hypothetical protein
MSHHFDSPTGREDPRINLCDLFVFAGESGSTVLIMTVNPDAGLSSPTTLRPDALYEFKIDLDGDAREDLAIRFVVESPEGGPQRVKVLRAAGEPARTGSEGAPLGAGGAGEAIALPGGGRAWFGLASDPFRGNGPALRAFFKAIDEGRFDAAPFDRQVDVFAGRNVTALVVELPSSNGRALGDAALDVVFTLLANRPLAGTVPADPATNARPFPYLAAPNTLAGDAKPLRAPQP